MTEKKKIYFISDLHLGLYPPEKSAEREKLLVQWLEDIKPETAELYLMGDIFDFWHEYKRVAPRGFTRFIGKLAELSDNGTQIFYFTGNHDVWVYDYLPKEVGLTLYRTPIIKTLQGLKFFLAHGDGLGPGDFSYKILKRIFTNRLLQWFFARLHPNFAMAIGHTWSKKSRYAKGIVAEPYRGDYNEFQIVFARKKLQHAYFDFFVFGHRHIPSDVTINEKSRVINLGDWINNYTYGVLEDGDFQLKSLYPENEKNIVRRKI
ncbi:MAG: UDP-2,3-diacylglucosamine diphosphatase [Bacteroidales bacterium]|nr:UDP-2,3-diacylglucosamine diphosphatase [Bacteroidales bacterium]